MIVQEPLQAAIWHCLNHYAYEDAIFLAERLCAEVDSDETIYLLATSYYRSGRAGQAYSVLKNGNIRSAQCRFLLAKCCYDLNKMAEAEGVLTNFEIIKPRSLEDAILDFGDLTCFATQLLARICAQLERKTTAVDASRKALKLNPFLWSSYETLCGLGEKPDPQRIFQVSHLENFNMCHGTNTVVNLVNTQNGEIGGTGSTCGTVGNQSQPNTGDLGYAATMYSTPVQPLSSLSIPLPVGLMGKVIDELAITSGASAAQSSSLLSSAARSTRSNNSHVLSGIKAFKCISGFNNSQNTPPPSFGVLTFDSSANESTLNSGKSFAFLTPPHWITKPTEQQATEQKVISRRQSKSVFSQSCNTSNTVNIVTTPSPQPPTLAHAPGITVRRSSRLFTSNNSVKENNKSPSRAKFVTPKSPSRKSKSRITRNQSNFNELNEKNSKTTEKSDTAIPNGNLGSSDIRVPQPFSTPSQALCQQAVTLQKQSVEGLMALLRDMGVAYLYLSQYDCRKAVECFNKLPAQHISTGWVLCHLGKAHFELTDYEQAVRYFSEVRELEPFRMELMELYSTALWHLQKEVCLSALAQELIAQDRNTAAAWCAAGNCFSLQKEHETAIKFFQRAVQVDPRFAYAYTLLGHEYVTTEELEKAMSCFRNAVRIDPRHYNSWYGIGMIYYKQEKYSLAEMYFRKALNINYQSSVLMCHIGVVQHALQNTDKALQMLNMGIDNDPRNPLCKFHRASIYFALERHDDALKELKELKEIVPKESLVYFLMGKVHNKLGNTHQALMHFSWAMDLDPKGVNSHIKEAIDPAVNKNSTEEDTDGVNAGNSETTEELQSEVSSVPAPESSQESIEFPRINVLDSDDSL